MKIAIVTNSSWSAYNFRSNLARAFIKDGHDVIFIIPFDNDYSEKLKKSFKCHNLSIDPKSINPLKDLKTFFNLLRVYSQVKPDVICHFTIKLNIYGSIAARYFNIPSVANITGLGTLFIKKNIITYFSEFLYKLSLIFTYKTFFQNIEDLNYFLKKKIITKANTELLPGSGVDLDKFQFSPLLINNDKFVFLLISRLLRDKGIYEYIEAIKLIRHRYPEKLIEFQLLGDAKSNNKTAIKISELEDWINKSLVNYLGVTDQVENIISECHCVVLPSYREGMPRSILEAFAIGRPVIVSDVPGCRDIVDHKTNGLLCKVKSSEDLARKMITMMRISQDIRNKLAKNGRKKVESLFDEKIVIKAYLKVINDIVSHEKIF
jgi:glycosyltransferase involved in cell wall biosynthesis